MPSVQMPRLSDSMETGKILRWLKKEGDDVKKGEPLVEIESDKANIEVEAYASGKLSKIVVQEGDSAPIGAVIAEIAGPPAGASGAEGAARAPEAVAAEAKAEEKAVVAAIRATDSGGEQYPQGGPDDRLEAGAAAQAALSAIRRPVEDAERDGRKASPVARRLADELHVDLGRVHGSGPGGRITKEDVEAAAQQAQPAVAATPSATLATRGTEPVARPSGEVEVVQLSKLQSTVALRLSQSFLAPHFYITSEIDMGDAVHLRQMFNEAVDKSEQISINDLIIKSVAVALTKFPQVNASWAEDRIERKRDINVGIAVGLPDRLLVPVLRNADQKSLKQIATESKALIERARTNKALADDFLGNTFTISNLGMYDVDHFTAIINPPDSAIMAVGSVEDKAVVKDGQVVIGKRMRATMSVDHRVIYGTTAAQFLQEVKRLLQSPMALVL